MSVILMMKSFEIFLNILAIHERCYYIIQNAQHRWLAPI